MKYVHGPRPELFDVEADPDELNNLIIDSADVGALMRDSLGAFLETEVNAAPSVQQKVDEETLAKLAALGYLQGGGDDSEIEERLRGDGVPPQDRVHLISKHSMVKNQIVSQQYRQARVLAAELVEESPENPLYRRLLATAELHLGLDDQAIEHLVPLLSPEHTETNRSLAMQALAVVNLTPARVMRMFGGIEKSEAQSPTATGQHLIARCLWLLGRQDEGERAVRRALVIEPGHLPSKIDLGTFLVRDQRVVEGRVLLEETVKEDPFSASAWQALGIARRRGGDPQSAGLAFARALELQPENTEVMSALIEVYMATNRESEARDLLAAMQRLSEGSRPELTRRVEDRWPEN
jgi:Flp pilus assembly protein TadD